MKSRQPPKPGVEPLAAPRVSRTKAAPEANRGYHHGNLRAALIGAGLQALEGASPQELSLRDLARRVGVSANAVYRHFANKEALLAALAAEGFRRLQAAQEQAVAGKPDADTGLRAAGRAYVQFAIDNPALFRLMYGGFTGSQNDPELVGASMAGMQAAVGMVAAHVGLPADDARVLPHVLLAWAITHGLGHLALGGQLQYFAADIGALIDEVFDLAQIVQPASRP